MPLTDKNSKAYEGSSDTPVGASTKFDVSESVPLYQTPTISEIPFSVPILRLLLPASAAGTTITDTVVSTLTAPNSWMTQYLTSHAGVRVKDCEISACVSATAAANWSVSILWAVSSGLRSAPATVSDYVFQPQHDQITLTNANFTVIGKYCHPIQLNQTGISSQLVGGGELANQGPPIISVAYTCLAVSQTRAPGPNEISLYVRVLGNFVPQHPF